MEKAGYTPVINDESELPSPQTSRHTTWSQQSTLPDSFINSDAFRSTNYTPFSQESKSAAKILSTDVDGPQLAPNAASQQLKPVTTNASNGSDALRSAILKFRARLDGKNLTDFQTTTYEQLCEDIRQIQHQQELLKSMMNLSRIAPCLEALEQFGKIIEVFVNVADVVAFVWGPIKFLLLTASTVSDSFETLLGAYEQIGEQLPLLLKYESLFREHPQMIGALELMYIDILEFHQHAIRFVSGKLWKRFFRSLWKDFGTKFDGILKRLHRHKNLIESSASVAQSQKYQQDQTNLMKDLESQYRVSQQHQADLMHNLESQYRVQQHHRVELNAKLDSQYREYREQRAEFNAKLEKLIEEEHAKKMKAVKEWLSVGSLPEQDHEDFQKVRSQYPNTGRWILKHDAVQSWMNSDIPNTPMLWMTGIPGAGKTILASAIIDECKRKTSYLTSYFYCHHDGPGTNTAVGVLKGLVAQLLDQYLELLPPCHTRYSSSGEPSLRSVTVAKKLSEDFYTTIPRLFIIIDGLDECEQYERKQLLEFFIDIIGQCDVEEPGKLRVLFVSQDYADIRRALHSSSITKITPKIILLSRADNEHDIQTYVRSWVGQIARKHGPLNDDLMEYLRNLTVVRAAGMFLYAKLVMLNLYDQPTREDLFEALRVENFPEGLEQAYERIVRRIKQTSHEKEWVKAKKLLGWMVCAKRQLTWREIQVALSIDLESQTIHYDDRRLRKHIHDICGSLVLLSGDRVSLVHSTAKLYITKCTKDIHEPSVECELAALCLQYLTFPCFNSDEHVNKNTLRQFMLQGHFAFQDYAVAKWFHHVNAFISTGQRLLDDGIDTKVRLEEISTALDDFMTMYDEEDWSEGVVQECREHCKIFEDKDFYENLVLLTSHIYTFQKKGFEARHKVSINSLNTALERNRKLLEDSPPKLKSEDLNVYRQFYDEERRFKCTRITCMYFSEGFKDAKSRKRHVNIHDRPYQCEVPDCLGAEGFANSKDLEKHTRSFHPEMSDLAESFTTVTVKHAKAVWACSICGKTFTRNFHRQNHEKSHRGERPHACPECGKAFTRLHDCKRHQKLHDRR